MTPEERIKKLEARVEELARENFRLRKSQKDQHHFRKILPRDKWYVEYLMEENKVLETICDDKQRIIEQYQKHYAKFGHFYTRYEEQMANLGTPLLDNPDNYYRGDTGNEERFPQEEAGKE